MLAVSVGVSAVSVVAALRLMANSSSSRPMVVAVEAEVALVVAKVARQPRTAQIDGVGINVCWR